MDSARPSIRDLNRDEQRFVIRTFLLAIGADQGLTRLAHVKREVRYEDVLKVLNVSTWPTAEATQVELAWMSEPLCHPDFPRLQTYSVFWSSSSALELWVGTTPRKPIQQSSFLTGATLLSTIIRFYGIRISEERRSSKLVRFAKRHWPQLVSYALLAVLVAGAFIYSYFRRGLVPWTFILPLIPIGTFLYHRFGPRLFGFVAYDLMFSLLLFFGLPYLVWSPPEHLPYGSDAEYPFLAGLAAATSLGVGVVLLQSILDREEESLAEMFRSRFRSLRRSLALMSVVTMAGYGAFLIHSYAVHQIFVEGNRIFVLLLVFGVIGLYAVLRALFRR